MGAPCPCDPATNTAHVPKNPVDLAVRPAYVPAITDKGACDGNANRKPGLCKRIESTGRCPTVKVVVVPPGLRPESQITLKVIDPIEGVTALARPGPRVVGAAG